MEGESYKKLSHGTGTMHDPDDGKPCMRLFSLVKDNGPVHVQNLEIWQHGATYIIWTKSCSIDTKAVRWTGLRYTHRSQLTLM
eukprot:6205871-Pleurochrysis_carterae.AAC.2